MGTKVLRNGAILTFFLSMGIHDYAMQAKARF